MLFRQITDSDLAQNAYLIGCQKTGEALIIDPERDVDRYLEIARDEDLEITLVAETHIHADFLSGARELANRGVKVLLSDEGPEDWKYFWAQRDDCEVQWLHDGDVFQIGKIAIEVLFSPGHTPEHISFVVTDHGGGASVPMGIASGDFVFVGDLGRPDLLESAAGNVGAREPAARTLYQSVQRFYDLSDHLQVWPGHGAGSACGKALGAVPMSTVGYEKMFNAALLDSRQGEDHFVSSILDGQPEPPLYFGRMKVLNKEGAPVLGELPQLSRLSGVTEAIESDAVIVDTRVSRADFLEQHIPGSIWAPLGSAFPAVAGSYVEPDREIVLVVDENELERAVRCLVRIGLDQLVAYLPPANLSGSELVSLPHTTFAEAGEAMKEPDAQILDVRGAGEFASGSLEGAINIAYTRLADRLDEVPRDKTLYVHCQSGRRATFACSMLKRSGYQVQCIVDDFENAA